MNTPHPLPSASRRQLPILLSIVLLGGISLSSSQAQIDGSWTLNGNGNWADSGNWLTDPAGQIPGGAESVVNFTIAIGGNRTIDLQSTSRTVGILNVGTASGSNAFLFTGDSGTTLTFDNDTNPAQLNFTATSRADSFAGLQILLASSLQIANAGIAGQTKLLGDATTPIQAATAGSKIITNSGSGAGRVWLRKIQDGTGTVAVVQNSATSPIILGLSGQANTYSGGTTLNSGQIFVATNATPFGSGPIAVNGGAINNSGSSGFSIGNSVTINNNVTFLDADSGTGQISLTGTVTITDNVELNVGKSTLRISATAIGESVGSRSLTKTGDGTLFLDANGIVTYTGGTIVKQGILSVAGAGDHLPDSAPVIVDGGAFNVSTTETIGALTLKSGSVGGTGGTFTASSYTVESGSISRILAGSGALTKNTAGIVNLTGDNTYTGATTVNAGTLLINGSTASGSAVSVGANGTLGGSGTINGATSIAGILSPGNSTGILNVNNNVTFTDGSTLAIELNGTTAGADYDRLNLTGAAPTLTLADTNNLQLTLGYNPSINDLFFLATLTGSNAISGVFEELNGVTTTLTQDSIFSFGGYSWQISYTGDSGTNIFSGAGNDLALQVVPEPSSWMLVGLAAMGLAAMRRKSARA